MNNFSLLYMINDGEKVCLHNVFGSRVGTTLVDRKTPMEREVAQFTPFEPALCRMLKENFLKISDNLEFYKDYKRTQPTVDTAFTSIKKFYPTTTSSSQDVLHDPAFQLAAAKLQYHVEKIKVNVIKVDDMLENMYDYLPEKSASAGLPYALKPNHKKLDVIVGNKNEIDNEFKNLVLAAQYIEKDFRYRKFASPCIVYQKSNVVHASADEKVRLIWGYPLAMTLLEGLFSIPLINACKELEQKETFFPTAYTFGPYGDQHRVYVTQGYPVVVRDFSSYDSTVPEVVIRVVFEMLFQTFQFEDEKTRHFYRNIFDVVQHYFIHTPLLLAQTSTLFCKHHGIPSGSWFTSLVGSFANYLMTTAAHLGTHQSFKSMKCMGDDNIAQYDQLPDTEKVASYMRENFGLIVNDSKTYAGPIIGAKFLGRYFRMPMNADPNDLWWYRPATTTLLQMMFPHEQESKEKLLIRLYALYLDNPTWWLFRFLKRFELQLNSAFSYQQYIDQKVLQGEWKYTHADIERNRMLRLTTMLDNIHYDKLRPPDELLRHLKERVMF